MSEQFRNVLSLCFLFIFSTYQYPGLAEDSDYRVFTNTQGRQMTGKLVAVSGQNVTILSNDGKTYTLPVSAFSKQDQLYIRQEGAGSSGGLAASKVGSVFGLEIFSDEPVWKSSASRMAERLKMKKVSGDAQLEVFYTSWFPPADHPGVQLLGAKPIRAQILARNDLPYEILFVFANRYDYLNVAWLDSKTTLTEEKVKAVTEKVAADLNTQLGDVEKNLTTLFGTAKQSTVAGSTMKRWSSGDCHFTMSVVPDRVLSLRITPFNPIPVVRPTPEMLSEKIEKKENGDTTLIGLPVSKSGALQSASFEIASRHVGASADADLLKNVGTTLFENPIGLSSRLEVLVEHLEDEGRTIKKIKGKLTMNRVEDEINKGYPIILGVRGTSHFRGCYLDRKDKRRSTTWPEYKEYLEEDVEQQALDEDEVADEDADSFTEITMLAVGYNADSGEVAIDFRWDANSRGTPVVWITLDELDHFSLRTAYVVMQ